MADKERLSIVVFSGDLDRALVAFMLAVTGASMGMEVTMFFTFWGLDIIKKNEGRIKSRGLMRRMLNLVNRGGSRRLKLSKLHMLGLGTWMMKQLMKDTEFPTLDELIGMARDLGVKFIACTTAMGIMGVNKDYLRSEVDEVAGAALFLNEARKAKVTLFI